MPYPYRGPERRQEMVDIAILLQKHEDKLIHIEELAALGRDEVRHKHSENKEVLSRLVEAVELLTRRVYNIESMFNIARWVVGIGGGLVILSAAQFFLNLYRGVHN